LALAKVVFWEVVKGRPEIRVAPAGSSLAAGVTPVCETVNVRPPMVIVPLRELAAALASTE